MAVFNRILNILVMIMAVLAAVFSWALFERRKEMRQRGDALAKTVHEAALLLDAKTPDGDKVATSVGVQGIEQGNGAIGWKNWHKPEKNTQYTGSLDNFVAAAGKVTKQRDANSTRLTTLDNLIREHDKDMLAVYNDAKQDEAAFKALEDGTKELLQRDGVLVNRLLKANQLFQPELEPTVEEIRKDYVALCDKLEGGIKHEQTQNQRKTATLENMAQILQKEYFGVTKDKIKELTETDKKTIDQNIENIKSELDRIVILKNTIKDREDTIKKKEAEIAEKQTEILKRQAMIDGFKEKVENMQNKINTMAETIRRMTESGPDNVGPVKYDGSILKVNYDYNYVIITFDEKKGQKLPVSAELTVARDREYIAKVQVTRVFKSYAVADILPDEREGEIIEGDRVLKLNF